MKEELKRKIYEVVKQIIKDYGEGIDFPDDGIEYAEEILTLIRSEMPGEKSYDGDWNAYRQTFLKIMGE